MIKQNELNKLSSNPQSTKVCLLSDNEGRRELLNLVSQCFNAMKTYGKAPEQMRDTGTMFCMVLGDYSIDEVRNAFQFYVKTNVEMPAPADIVNIIERKGRPAFDKSVYLSLKKRKEADPYAYNVLTRDEQNYIKDYERFQVTGKFS